MPWVKPTLGTTDERINMAACCSAPCGSQEKDPYKDHGMIAGSSRKCRDMLCLLFFFLFCIGMLVIGAIGIRYGKPQRLVYGTDYRGFTCGVDTEVKDRKYTAFPRTTEDFLTNIGKSNPLDYKFYGVCVSKCPGLLDVVCNSESAALDTQPQYTQANKLDCLSDFGFAGAASVDCDLVRSNCWITPQPTSSVLFRCIPNYNITASGLTTCIYPANVTDADDARCVLAQTVSGTTVQRPAKPNFLFDQMNTARQLWGRWFGDLHRAWWVVLVCSVALAVVLGFVFTLFMKYFTGCMVWTTLVLVIVGLAALDIWFYFKGGILNWDMVPDDVEARIKSLAPRVSLPNIAEAQAAQRYVSALVPDVFGNSQLDRQQAYRIVAYIFSAVVVIVFAMVVALRRSISTAIAVIKLGSDAMRHLPTLVLFPPIAAVGFAAFLLWWIFVAASLGTAGSITTADLAGDVADGVAYLSAHFANSTAGVIPPSILTALNAPTINATIHTVKDIPVLNYLLIYHFFGLLWITQFHNGVIALTIAGAVCGWYFSLNESNSPEVEVRRFQRGRFPVCAALGRTLRYYLGSVAFGSLLIAFIQFVRSVFAYIQRQLNKSNGGAGPSAPVKFVMCCIQCCLKCLQTVVEMVTRNAYIFIALKGVSFCAAGKRVFHLLATNAATLLFVNVLSEIIMFVGRVGIAAAAGWGCYVLLDTVPRFAEGGEDEITSTWLVVLVTMFFAYAVAGGFLSIFDLAVDSILVCYVTDMEENAERGGGKVPVHVKADKLAFAKARKQREKQQQQGGDGLQGNPIGSAQVAPARASAGPKLV